MPLRDFDRQLLKACLEHQPGSWTEFVDRYIGLIYHVIGHVSHARSIPLTEADVEDLCAEILVRISDDDYAVLRRFRGRSSLPTYLTVMARRLCIKEMVKRQRESFLGHATAHRAGLPPEEHDEVEPVAPPEDVKQMLLDASGREEQVIRLYHLSYLTYRQISKQVGATEKEVGRILSEARKRLQAATEGRT